MKFLIASACLFAVFAYTQQTPAVPKNVNLPDIQKSFQMFRETVSMGMETLMETVYEVAQTFGVDLVAQKTLNDFSEDSRKSFQKFLEEIAKILEQVEAELKKNRP